MTTIMVILGIAILGLGGVVVGSLFKIAPIVGDFMGALKLFVSNMFGSWSTIAMIICAILALIYLVVPMFKSTPKFASEYQGYSQQRQISKRQQRDSDFAYQKNIYAISKDIDDREFAKARYSIEMKERELNYQRAKKEFDLEQNGFYRKGKEFAPKSNIRIKDYEVKR